MGSEMATVSTNTTLTLDGVTPINVNGIDTVTWSALDLQGLFLSPGASGLTVTLDLVSSWTGGMISASGSLGTIIGDDALDGARWVEGIFLADGVDTINLARTNVEALSTRGGNDVITIDQVWVGWLHAGNGDDVITTDAYAWVNWLDTGEGTNAVNVLAGTSGVDMIAGRSGADTIHAYANVGTIDTRGGDDRVETGGNWINLIETGAGADTVIAAGSVRTINAGDGVDSVLTTAGTWTHLINGGDGDDVMRINGESDMIDGGAGNDSITTGADWIGNIDAAAGRDLVTLGGGATVLVDLGRDADTLFVEVQANPDDLILAKGGEGVSGIGEIDRDTVNFRNFTQAVQVRLDQHSARSTQGNLTLIDFENAVGGSGNDLLAGDAQDNLLLGGSGNDILVAGLGRDRLTGGLGADTFRFFGLDDKPDWAIDFNRTQGDKIGLGMLDANTVLAGNQAFTFIGDQRFHGQAGELRTIQGDGWVRVTGDLNGDRIGDFHIFVQTATPLDLTAQDFYL